MKSSNVKIGAKISHGVVAVLKSSLCLAVKQSQFVTFPLVFSLLSQPILHLFVVAHESVN